MELAPLNSEVPALLEEGTVTKVQVMARMVEYAPGRFVALPLLACYALLENPAGIPVPGVARYAHGLLAWQRSYIPMIDLNALLLGKPASAQAPRYALVVAYLGAGEKGKLEFAALALHALPLNIMVGDDSQCALPDDCALWGELALSCFVHDGHAVPILDTTKLFAASHRIAG
jgi:hypothetical protein